MYLKKDESDNFKFLVKKVKKSACFKWTYGLSGNEYRVAALSSYLLTKRAKRYGWTETNFRKASFFKILR